MQVRGQLLAAKRVVASIWMESTDKKLLTAKGAKKGR